MNERSLIANDNWYHRKSYTHFDLPLTERAAERLVKSPDLVRAHAFWPVIVNPKRDYVFKYDSSGRRRRSKKIRPICICAHRDAYIFSYYATLLNQRLEAIYAERGGDHVLAYRRFTPAKCNVHFAVQAFEEIKNASSCDVVALDVEGFFDVLDHGLLKAAWCSVLNCKQLPEDHYAVFKASTRESAVTIPTLRDLFGGEIRRRLKRSSTAICCVEDFRKKVKPVLESRHSLIWKIKRKQRPANAGTGPIGITQGSPISAVLANIYMLEADQRILSRLKVLGGSYRRYSDDILAIVPAGSGAAAEQIVIDELNQVRLSVSTAKTERITFRTTLGSLQCHAVDSDWMHPCRSPASYLGLQFDGNEIRVRPSTVAAFEIKARRAIKRAMFSAIDQKQPRIKRRQLYARLTFKGYGRVYGVRAARGKPPRSAPRLGFFRYLGLVQRITASTAVRRQAKQIESRVVRLMDQADERVRARLMNGKRQK